MEIILVNYNERRPVRDDGKLLDSPRSLLDQYFPLRLWAEGLVDAGANVTVYLRYFRHETFEREGVSYIFVPDFGFDKSYLILPYQMNRLIANQTRTLTGAGQQVVVQISGLIFPLQVRLLRAAIGKGIPLVCQHRGSRPWTPGLKQAVQKWGYRPADTFLFAARQLAEEWTRAKIIHPDQSIHEVMECSSALSYLPRTEARKRTNMTGEPVLFWAGNLNQNKDPITILKGFEQVLAQFPEAKLYMAYREAGLIDLIEKTIRKNPRLSHSVTLLGAIPYREMGNYFNSSDIFVQGSSKEGSGIALLDALACGVIPVVTDIPSFRVLTDGGKIGRLWKVGLADSFAGAVFSVLQDPIPPQREAALDLSRRKWSNRQIGLAAMKIYKSVWAQKWKANP